MRTLTSILTLLAIMASFASAIEPRRPESEEEKNRRVALQAKYKELPEVKLNRVKEDVKFQIVDMRKTITEVNGAKHCAFRFKTADKVSQLTWCFRFPPGIRRWYIMPEKGRMEGFFHFDRFVFNHDDESEGWGSNGDLFAVQSLPSRYFEPNTGYIIWFEIRDNADSAINLSLNMLPVPDGSTYSAVFPTITLADH